MTMKIKDENDYLGLLIKNMRSDKYVDYSKIFPYLDEFNIISFNNSLQSKGWIYTTHNEGLYLTTVGINNYISLKDHICNFLIFLLKFVMSFLSGILSGVAIAFFVFKLGL